MVDEGSGQGVPLPDGALAIDRLQAPESGPRVRIIPAPDPKIRRIPHKQRRLHNEIPGSFFGEKALPLASRDATGTVQKYGAK